LFIENGPEDLEAYSHPFHPKNAKLGTKAVVQYRRLLIERDDALAI